jgi:hypothetical protein
MELDQIYKIYFIMNLMNPVRNYKY